jgi:hypothetical protein
MAQQLYEISINQHDQSGNFFMSRLMYAITESGNEDFWKLANDFIAAWSLANETAWLKLQGADVVLDYYKCKRVTGGGGPSALKIVATTGGDLSPCCSAGLCADLQLQNTNISNRPGHTYIGGVPSGSILGDQWQAAFVINVNALITKLLTPVVIAGSNGVLSILYKKLKSWTSVTHGQLSPKPTLLNKRTVPLV